MSELRNGDLFCIYEQKQTKGPQMAKLKVLHYSHFIPFCDGEISQLKECLVIYQIPVRGFKQKSNCHHSDF